MRGFLKLLTGANLLAATAVHAAVLIPVPPPAGVAPQATAVFGINDDNVIAGSYFTPDGVEHGFYGTLDGNYTTFDVGDSGVTEPRGINNAGIIMGICCTTTGDALPWERYSDGSFAYVTLKHGAPLGQGISGAINAGSTFVASGWNSLFSQFFSFFGEGGQATKAINFPGVTRTFPRGLNDGKDVVGFYVGDDGRDHGFLKQNGVWHTFDYPDPNMTGTYLYGINNTGLIAGTWTDGKNNSYGFVYSPFTDKFSPIEEKHATRGKYALVYGINNAGMIAVDFPYADGPFIYCPYNAKKCAAAGGIATSRPQESRTASVTIGRGSRTISR